MCIPKINQKGAFYKEDIIFRIPSVCLCSASRRMRKVSKEINIVILFYGG